MSRTFIFPVPTKSISPRNPNKIIQNQLFPSRFDVVIDISLNKLSQKILRHEPKNISKFKINACQVYSFQTPLFKRVIHKLKKLKRISDIGFLYEPYIANDLNILDQLVEATHVLSRKIPQIDLIVRPINIQSFNLGNILENLVVLKHLQKINLKLYDYIPSQKVDIGSFLGALPNFGHKVRVSLELQNQKSLDENILETSDQLSILTKSGKRGHRGSEMKINFLDINCLTGQELEVIVKSLQNVKFKENLISLRYVLGKQSNQKIADIESPQLKANSLKKRGNLMYQLAYLCNFLFYSNYKIENFNLEQLHRRDDIVEQHLKDLVNLLTKRSQIKNLKLDIEKNTQTNANIFRILAPLYNKQTLQNLKLNFQNSPNISFKFIRALAQGLMATKKLETLCLQFGQENSSDFGDESLMSLGSALTELRLLRTLKLDISGSVITNEGIRVFQGNLLKLQGFNLQQVAIDFSGCLGLDQMAVLALQGLCQKLKGITQWHIDFTKIKKITQKEVQSLISILSNQQNIKRFNILADQPFEEQKTLMEPEAPKQDEEEKIIQTQESPISTSTNSSLSPPNQINKNQSFIANLKKVPSKVSNYIAQPVPQQKKRPQTAIDQKEVQKKKPQSAAYEQLQPRKSVSTLKSEDVEKAIQNIGEIAKGNFKAVGLSAKNCIINKKVTTKQITNCLQNAKSKTVVYKSIPTVTSVRDIANQISKRKEMERAK